MNSSSASNSLTFNDTVLSSAVLYQQRLIATPSTKGRDNTTCGNAVHLELRGVETSLSALAECRVPSTGIAPAVGCRCCSYGIGCMLRELRQDALLHPEERFATISLGPALTTSMLDLGIGRC